jgi:hypothetical protein
VVTNQYAQELELALIVNQLAEINQYAQVWDK